VVEKKLLDFEGRPACLLLVGRVVCEDVVNAPSRIFGKWRIVSCLAESSMGEIGGGKLLLFMLDKQLGRKELLANICALVKLYQGSHDKIL